VIALTERRSGELRAILDDACRRVGLDPSGANLITYSSNAVFGLRAPAIVRLSIAPDSESQARQLVATSEWLDSQRAPIAPLLPGLPQPSLGDGWAATFWVELVAVDNLTSGDLAQTLRTFHEIQPQTKLPRWDKFSWARELLDRAVGLPFEDHEWLVRAWEQAQSDYEAQASGMPHGLVHGDAHTGNLLRTPTGRPLLCDLDNVCYGPIDWDLTPNAVSAIRFNRPADIRTFTTEYGRDVTQQLWWPTLRIIRELVMVTYMVNDLHSRPGMKDQWSYRMSTLRAGRTDAPWTIIK
jgi:aminoglycoside phosphotransferase (APT) family kinase protein